MDTSANFPAAGNCESRTSPGGATSASSITWLCADASCESRINNLPVDWPTVGGNSGFPCQSEGNLFSGFPEYDAPGKHHRVAINRQQYANYINNDLSKEQAVLTLSAQQIPRVNCQHAKKLQRGRSDIPWINQVAENTDIRRRLKRSLKAVQLQTDRPDKFVGERGNK